MIDDRIKISSDTFPFPKGSFCLSVLGKQAIFDDYSLKMGIEHSRTNYYLIAGISVIIGVLLLVAICVCFMNFCKLLNVFRKSDQTDNQRVSSSFALEEIHPLALNTNNTRIFTASDFPPTYIETTSV